MNKITSERQFLPVNIALLTVSDSRTLETDKSGDTLEARILEAGHKLAARTIVKDEQALIVQQLRTWIADPDIDTVISTGGTGLTGRDITPEATEAVCEKLLPGFGEQMRAVSLRYVSTAILSRQLAGVRGATLFINLPGSPQAIAQCLDAVFAAVPACVDLIGGPRLETNPERGVAYRPHD